MSSNCTLVPYAAMARCIVFGFLGHEVGGFCQKQANEIHKFLQRMEVEPAGDNLAMNAANTAGVRVMNMGATCIQVWR